MPLLNNIDKKKVTSKTCFEKDVIQSCKNIYLFIDGKSILEWCICIRTIKNKPLSLKNAIS